MGNYLNNLTETKPLVVGVVGATGGVGAGILQYLKVAGEVAGSVGALLGCLVAVLSVILLVKQIRKN